MKGLISVAVAMLSLASARATSAAWRRPIPRNPELDFQEVRTGKLVAAY